MAQSALTDYILGQAAYDSEGHAAGSFIDWTNINDFLNTDVGSRYRDVYNQLIGLKGEKNGVPNVPLYADSNGNITAQAPYTDESFRITDLAGVSLSDFTGAYNKWQSAFIGNKANWARYASQANEGDSSILAGAAKPQSTQLLGAMAGIK